MEYVIFYTRTIEILPDGYHLLLGYNVMTNSPLFTAFVRASRIPHVFFYTLRLSRSLIKQNTGHQIICLAARHFFRD